MHLLSDGAWFVRLVVLVVLLFSSDFITCFLTFGDITFPPICATGCCGRSLLCVFSVWNAKCLINFQFFTTDFNSFQFYSTGFNTFQFYSTGFNTTLSFDLGLPFLCPFLRDPFTRSVPAIHAILLLPFPCTCVTFCCNFVPFWQSCMIYLGETLIGLTP